MEQRAGSREQRAGSREQRVGGWRSASLEVGGFIQLAAVLSSHRASRHVAAPSLGQYATLSFVVIGKEQRTV